MTTGPPGFTVTRTVEAGRGAEEEVDGFCWQPVSASMPRKANGKRRVGSTKSSFRTNWFSFENCLGDPLTRPPSAVTLSPTGARAVPLFSRFGLLQLTTDNEQRTSLVLIAQLPFL